MNDKYNTGWRFALGILGECVVISLLYLLPFLFTSLSVFGIIYLLSKFKVI